MNRKEQLKSWDFRKLQSTEEYKHYCDIYLNMRLMNEEVEYILKQSYEDSDAPFSYEDIEMFYYEEEELINAIMEELEEQETEEEIKKYLEVINEELYHNKDNKEERKERLKQYLKENLDLEELKELIGDSLDSYLTLEDYEHQTEVMQWFYVDDDRILDQLRERGEVVLNGKFWGRQSYGQSITMDGVIIEIFKNWYLELYGLPFDLNKEVQE